jgi:plastocyanin
VGCKDLRTARARGQVRTLILLAGLATIAAAAFLPLAARTGAASTVTVEISDLTFQPASVTVHVGDTVSWTNLGSMAHTVDHTDRGGQPKLLNELLFRGQSFSYTFTEAGTYHYFCVLHQEKTGTVIVQAGGAEAGQLPDGAMAGDLRAHATSVTRGEPRSGSLIATALGVALLLLGLLGAIAIGARRPGDRLRERRGPTMG